VWNDADGLQRAAASLVPNAQAAARRITEEFDSEKDPVPPLSSYCVNWGCRAFGFVGPDHISVFVSADPPGEGAAEAMTALESAVTAAVSAAQPASELPPLSAEWSDGPTSCEEMLPAEQFAEELGVSELLYLPGYAYEESDGGDHAVLTAGGFSCRYRPDGLAQGHIAVLPDAAAALATARERAEGITPVEVDGAEGAVVYCWNNGEPAWSEGSTGSCTVDLPVRGAWVRVSSADSSVPEAELVESARVAASLVAARLS
jgi:hypothetical protein